MLTDLIHHLEWADAEMWRAVLEQCEEPLEPELHALLHHLEIVPNAFLRVWRGEPIELPAAKDFSDSRDLARWGRRAHRELQKYLAGADDAELDRVLVFPWADELVERFGRPADPVKLSETAVQVAMHSTHHRGQVMARLRAAGGEPPLVDFIGWLWLGRPEPRWPEALDD